MDDAAVVWCAGTDHLEGSQEPQSVLPLLLQSVFTTCLAPKMHG